MTILPSQVSSILKLYHMLVKSEETEAVSESEIKDSKSRVSVLQEAKRRQIQRQTKQEVIKRLKKVLLDETR